jgi:hypothetical protein
MAHRAYKRSWKNYLLNTRYQLRFTLFMVAVSAVLMCGLGFWVNKRASAATKISIQNVQGNPLVFPDPEPAIRELERKQDFIGYTLIGVGVALSFGLFLFGIKMTHKVAGPIFKMTLYLDKMRDGKFDTVYPLRKGDQLVEFYEHFKQAHGALRARQVADVEHLRDVIAAVDKSDVAAKSPELAARLVELKQLLATKEAGLV